MPPRTKRVPSYRLHRPSGQARVIINGTHIYLGKFGTPESWEKYNRIIAEKLQEQGLPDSPLARPSPQQAISVNEAILAYWGFAKEYYRKHGEVTGEVGNIRVALRPLRRLYGSTPAKDFGPDALELVRQAMIDDGLSRGVINARVSRIKRMFRWASKKKLVPAETYYGLLAVEGLRRGRSKARETSPITVVPEAHVTAILSHLLPAVAAMVQVQELAGMRPQDIRNMRTCDLDMSGDIWVYTPWTHKTEHHGIVRRIAIGPKAQAILSPFLKPEDPTSHVFSPRDAVKARREERGRQRKTRRTPSELANKKAKPRRTAGEQYTKSSYETAIRRACVKAGVPHWKPNQLRHNCATRVRKVYGAEGAAAVLGNSLGMVVEVYADSNFDLAKKIMREIG